MNKFLKVIAIVLCAATLVVASVAATVAYLTMKTSTVQNTFTSGNIKIELKQESQLDSSKMVPGQEFRVDPKVTVYKESESCYLFIKIEKSANFDTFLSYEVADGWTELTDGSGVYYREVNYNAADDAENQVFDVIADNTITAKSDCTKGDYDGLTDELNLKFTAYAVQKVGFDTAADAWVEAQKLDNSNTENNGG